MNEERMTPEALAEIEGKSKKCASNKLPALALIFSTERELALDAVPQMAAEIRRAWAENDALRHIVASMNREPETYGANGLRVKVVDGRVAVEYGGGGEGWRHGSRGDGRSGHPRRTGSCWELMGAGGATAAKDVRAAASQSTFRGGGI